MVNGVVYRDSSKYGTKIRLRVFVDRLEMLSPEGR
jgi:predicted HTH transcriptional regulator